MLFLYVFIFHNFLLMLPQYGEAPLHCAAQRGHDSVVELLLHYGALVDEKDVVSYIHIYAFMLIYS